MQSNWRTKRNRNLGSLRVVCAVLLLSGCSVNQIAVNILGDTLANGGSVYMADNDPVLIREALPFGLKTFESMLELSPDHRGLLLSASRGFTAYALILQQENTCRHESNGEQKPHRPHRIRDLFLRGRDYALRGLSARYADFENRLRENPVAALTATDIADAPFLYWAGAAWGGAISAAKGDLHLLVELPIAGALVRRVLELDESYDHGAAHEFFIAYEASRPGGSTEQARKHYRRALELSGGRRASVHLALAETVSVKVQNLAEFHSLLVNAMTVPVEKYPEFRLVNALARERAAWLKKHIEEFFVDAPPPKENAG